MNMNVTPLHDRILVKLVEAEKVSEGGIVIPDAATEKPNIGTVISAGPGKYKNGKFVETVVKAGDTIIFGKGAGFEVKIKNEKLVMLDEDMIYGIMKD